MMEHIVNTSILWRLISKWTLALALCTTAPQQVSSDTIPVTAAPEIQLRERSSTLMFDYQTVKLTNGGSLDLLGYHMMTPVNNWLSVGLGSYAPVSQGNYGGFMAFGGLLHTQRNISDRMFVTGGFSFGGGGGGSSVAQSVELSGTGGFAKAYTGLGYRFKNFSVGVNISHFKFFKSAIDSSQFNVFLQLPTSFRTARHSLAGDTFSLSKPARTYQGPESMVFLGLDNYNQIDPVGSSKGMIQAVDLQYSRFLSEKTYLYYALGVGIKGLPTYNQVIGGIGSRFKLSPWVNLYAQVGIGSGGYAPSLIDTGSGLLAYPKVSAEYMVNQRTGLAVTAGYLIAPDGTSKNVTFGFALNSHFGAAAKSQSANQRNEGKYRGHRLSVSNEIKISTAFRGVELGQVKLLNAQLDRMFNEIFYMAYRGSIALEAYKGKPGYGEVSVGLGVQSKYREDSVFQYFTELQAGVNVEGTIVRAGAGMIYSLTEDVGLRGVASQTMGHERFRSTNLELGLTYRFSSAKF